MLQRRAIFFILIVFVFAGIEAASAQTTDFTSQIIDQAFSPSATATQSAPLPQSASQATNASVASSTSTIVSLQALIKTLEAELQALIAARQGGGCTITKNIGPGSTGPDVTCLQKILVSQNLLSSDSATGYYGVLTTAAVKSFQKSHGLVSSGTPATTAYGVVGPKTRAALNALRPTISGSSSGSTSTSTTATSTTTTPVYPIYGGGGGGGGGSSGGGGVGGGGAPADTTPPSVPTNLATTSVTTSEIDISWSASTDNVAVSYYEVFRNGVQVGTPTGTAFLDGGLSSGTTYTYTVSAVDSSGNASAQSTALLAATASSGADTTPPTVSLTAPTNGAAVTGTSVSLSATASDNVALAGVTFYIDNIKSGSEDSTAPYGITWDSTSISDGTHTISAVARDTSNNYATSSISVTVENSAPLLSSISSNTPGQTSATISWTSDQTADSQVNYGLSNTYGSTTTLNSILVTSHSVVLSGLSPSTTYHYRVRSTDGAGLHSVSTDQTFTTTATPDTTPPTVSLTAPTNGAAVTGTSVSLSATASDNVAVAGVTFYIDSTKTGSEDTTSPYGITWNSTSVADGSHTISAVARDTSNNYATSTISITVRNTPPAISNISSGSPTTTAATITWTTDENANSKVVYGLTTGYGSASSSASLVTSHSIGLSGLTAGTTYHFAVVSTDGSSNTSTSTDGTFTTTDSAPVLSSIVAGSLSNNAATITWTTDENANSKVVYGLNTSYGSASSSASLLTSHSISLSGLATSTTYHYTVVSTDSLGTAATSSDQTFTTTSTGEPYLSAISSGSPTTTAATITWTTDENANSKVVYGLTTGYGSASSSASLVTSHSIGLSGLTAGTTYHFAVVSTDGSSNTSTSTDGTFTTTDSAPVLSSIVAGSLSNNAATITWTTDENANSKVVYGLNTSYGSASSSASLLTSHSISLSGLATSTTYHYTVVSTDSLGTAATSSDQTFTTTSTGEPYLSAISSGSPTTTAATITWTTDENANSKVVYGLTTGYGSASSSASLVTSHSIGLSGLTAGTTYHFAVVSTDGSSNTSTSTDGTFTTASSGGGDTQAPTTPTNLVATPVSASQINLSWTASTDNVGVAGYQIFRDGIQVATDTSGTTYNDTGLATQTLHSYSIAAYDAANNVSTSSLTVAAQSQYGADQYGTIWKPLRVGAGGFIRGMDIAPDGTKVIHTDTYGAYLWDGTQWDQLVSTSTIPSIVDVNNNMGVYEIRIAPSNSNIFYMSYLNCSGCAGGIFKTINRGATWTKTNFTDTNDSQAEANGTYAQDGQKMAIDPINPNVVYVGTETAGLWVTSDGGNTWTNIPSGTIPYGPAITGITFDPSSGTTGGKTNTIYASSWGNGVYESTNAGVSWSHLSGGPTSVQNAEVANGIYYAADGTSAWKYSGGVWTNMVNEGGNGAHSIAVDPSNGSHIVVASPGGTLDVSTNGGSTWTGLNFSPGSTRVATDVPWLAWTNETYMTSGNMIFDPTASDKLYFAEGIGVWYATAPNSMVAFNWNSQNTNIEQLVTDQIISPPGGNPIVASWDRPVFRINNPDIYPSTHGPSNAVAISRGYSADYASNNPSFIVVATDNNGVIISNDGGSTWSATTGSAPSGYGGDIAAASSTDMVQVPFNGNPAYTKDGGATWATVSGVTSSGWASYYNRFIVAADRVNIGTYYLYNGSGVFRSTDGGATWTEVETGELISFDWYSSELEAVPGMAGNLFYAAGQASPDSLNSPQNENFLHSVNGGVTWTAVPNVKEVKSFGFGAPAVGTTTPSIYIAGWVNSHYGIYRSIDNGATWTQIGLWPVHSLDAVSTVSGDMNTFGRVYVGFSGSGSAYGDSSDAAAWVSLTTPTPNATVNGTSVTLSATTTNNVAITNVQFKVDGTNIGSADTSAPYTITWDSTGISDGTHTLYAVSLAANGKYATSSVTVTVQNGGPSITNIASGSILQSSATITWTTNNSSNSKVVYGTTTGYGSASSSATMITSHSIGITGLTPSTLYHFAVVSTDGLGNSSTSTDQTFTTTAPDTTPPSTPTSLNATAASQSQINLTWTASTDNVGVAGYQVFRGGVQVATTTTNSYNDTGLLPTTGYTYTVTAFDAAGNISATSSPSSATTQSGIAFSATASPPLQNFGYSTESVTYSNVNIGVATSSRIVVVAVFGGLPPSIKINGISATLATSTAPESGGFTSEAIWYATVATSTTATIVLGSNAYSEVGIQVASMVGANPTPSSLATLAGGYKLQSDMHITATVPTNGVGVVFASESTTAPIPSWTNATGDTYTNDTTNGYQIILAHTYASGSQTPQLGNSNGQSYDYNDGGMVMVTWGP